ncbi:MAG: glycoside hydrolase family 26 protein [Candidatus Lokiarchaeota archaeon]|nr:glycoside hydrolase family 26 protein [Candidatus Harpocratesius repetitus]
MKTTTISKILLIFLLSGFVINQSFNFGASSEEDRDFKNKKALWIEDAFNTLNNQSYNRIKAISYWHENWDNGGLVGESKVRLDSSIEATTAYKIGISDEKFGTEAKWENTSNGVKLIPNSEGIYHSAYPDFNDSEDSITANAITDFQELVGKKIVWAYFTNPWMEHIEFPAEAVDVIHNLGIIPFIRMFPISSYDRPTPDPVYSLQKIVDGMYDSDLRVWANDAKSIENPLIIEFGTEVNGDWFAWNAKWNGGCNTGPELFKAAYRHIIDLFREENATDITWVFHVDDYFEVDDPCTNMSVYYPGDDYIDWIGISIYGALDRFDHWESFSNLMAKAYPYFSSISTNKPLALLEFGVIEPDYFFISVSVGIFALLIGFLALIVIIRRKRRK